MSEAVTQRRSFLQGGLAGIAATLFGGGASAATGIPLSVAAAPAVDLTPSEAVIVSIGNASGQDGLKLLSVLKGGNHASLDYIFSHDDTAEESDADVFPWHEIGYWIDDNSTHKIGDMILNGDLPKEIDRCVAAVSYYDSEYSKDVSKGWLKRVAEKHSTENEDLIWSRVGECYFEFHGQSLPHLYFQGRDKDKDWILSRLIKSRSPKRFTAIVAATHSNPRNDRLAEFEKLLSNSSQPFTLTEHFYITTALRSLAAGLGDDFSQARNGYCLTWSDEASQCLVPMFRKYGLLIAAAQFGNFTWHAVIREKPPTHGEQKAMMKDWFSVVKEIYDSHKDEEIRKNGLMSIVHHAISSNFSDEVHLLPEVQKMVEEYPEWAIISQMVKYLTDRRGSITDALCHSKWLDNQIARKAWRWKESDLHYLTSPPVAAYEVIRPAMQKVLREVAEQPISCEDAARFRRIATYVFNWNDNEVKAMLRQVLKNIQS